MVHEVDFRVAGATEVRVGNRSFGPIAILRGRSVIARQALSERFLCCCLLSKRFFESARKPAKGLILSCDTSTEGLGYNLRDATRDLSPPTFAFTFLRVDGGVRN